MYQIYMYHFLIVCKFYTTLSSTDCKRGCIHLIHEIIIPLNLFHALSSTPSCHHLSPSFRHNILFLHLYIVKTTTLMVIPSRYQYHLSLSLSLLTHLFKKPLPPPALFSFSPPFYVVIVTLSTPLSSLFHIETITSHSSLMLPPPPSPLLSHSSCRMKPNFWKGV